MYNRDSQVLLHLPRDIPLWGKKGRRSIDVKTPRVFFEGPLAIQLMVPPRQPKRMEKGWGEAGELGRHSSSCNFRICGHICVPSSEKNPPTPHHAPATVCLTQSSRTLKKTQSASSSFWGRGWVMGVSVSLEAGAGRGQTDKVSLRTRKPLASLRSSRASEGIQVSRGSAGASTQSVRKACRVCRPWRRWRWPCR